MLILDILLGLENGLLIILMKRLAVLPKHDNPTSFYTVSLFPKGIFGGIFRDIEG
jgi:hypothetical protein